MQHIKRFDKTDRLFHIFLMVTFLVQTATGFGRLFLTTLWGRKVISAFGGYETSFLIHQWVGILMTGGFVVHILYAVRNFRWQNLGEKLFGPDSLVPNLKDLRDLRQNIRWFFGTGPPPRFDRWTYWEKFDYWAVFWGMPLLAVTGLMLMFPLHTSRVLPGWSLNIAAFLHRAEALLAISYIFIVHFFIGHVRPANFPMSEAMFSGTLSLEHATEEKPAWVERLKKEEKLAHSLAEPPSRWVRVLSYLFGYSALFFGLYLLINGIIYSRHIRLH